MNTTRFLIPSSFAGAVITALAICMATVDGDVLATIALAVMCVACSKIFSGCVDYRADFEDRLATQPADRS